MDISPLLGKKHHATPKGLTLVELLVVITIIVVLAALSTLGVARIRSAARGANCTSNLRQVGVAMLSYASDKNGQLPPLEDRTGSGDSLKGDLATNHRGWRLRKPSSWRAGRWGL